MLTVVIRMAFYCVVFQRFGRSWWPSSGNTNCQIIIHEVVYCVHSRYIGYIALFTFLKVWLLGGISILCS